MKWFILIVALGSDIALLIALSVVLYVCWPVGLVCLLFTLGAWKDVGGWEAWKPSTIKAFLKNWEKVK